MTIIFVFPSLQEVEKYKNDIGSSDWFASDVHGLDHLTGFYSYQLLEKIVIEKVKNRQFNQVQRLVEIMRMTSQEGYVLFV